MPRVKNLSSITKTAVKRIDTSFHRFRNDFVDDKEAVRSVQTNEQRRRPRRRRRGRWWRRRKGLWRDGRRRRGTEGTLRNLAQHQLRTRSKRRRRVVD